MLDEPVSLSPRDVDMSDTPNKQRHAMSSRRATTLGAVNFETVVDALRANSAHTPDRKLFTFLPDGEEEEPSLTSSMLDAKARAVAAILRTHVEPGSRALLLFAPGQDFIIAFFGCLYAGVVAVPAYPQRGRGMLRLAGIAEDAQPAAVLTTSSIRTFAEAATGSIPELQETAWLTVDTIPDGYGAGWSPPALLEASSVAFLQYTSGSTGQPKGVMVTHGNLIHNIELICRSLDLDESTVNVGWLPPYHDMGLISMIILPAVMRIHSVLMPTMAFLQRPVRWLHAISKYRGTASAAPNFAFELCARKVPEEDRKSLDLSSWAVVANGAEPIRAESLQRFCYAFASSGFRPEAIVPVYGLAESTLMVSGAPTAQPRIFRAFDGGELERGVARGVPEGSPDARVLVGCGISQGLEVAIVDPQERVRCRLGQVGEIWVAGESVAVGYWQRPDVSREVFAATLSDSDEGPFMRTGDLGFQTEEGLFVTGRIKDVIIVAGRNHYPQDIERTTECAHSAIRPGCVAVFSVETDGEEAVVVAVEVRRETGGGKDSAEPESVARAVRRAVMQEHRLAVRDVVLLPAGSLPKTSSGKLQRGESRKDYLAGQSPWNGKGLRP
ncbi:fatty acyl-AMP ligase [Streptomyces sp. NBC_01481]|uniref:fatty acyl-AMP ligase n=1 Tax=Streptomyces sp. NBC_01481 TaxID=2975869 RepID=UPI00225B4E16|nr:fatty acyl-AMP ligase [Streptomyces sp. NBC_01481]MCX4588130.1 fatty acyl-AMP ligase [Streptomyces sp. NBC_01481]